VGAERGNADTLCELRSALTIASIVSTLLLPYPTYQRPLGAPQAHYPMLCRTIQLLALLVRGDAAKDHDAAAPPRGAAVGAGRSTRAVGVSTASGGGKPPASAGVAGRVAATFPHVNGSVAGPHPTKVLRSHVSILIFASIPSVSAVSTSRLQRPVR
jgi:hypothetical protein